MRMRQTLSLMLLAGGLSGTALAQSPTEPVASFRIGNADFTQKQVQEIQQIQAQLYAMSPEVENPTAAPAAQAAPNSYDWGDITAETSQLDVTALLKKAADEKIENFTYRRDGKRFNVKMSDLRLIQDTYDRAGAGRPEKSATTLIKLMPSAVDECHNITLDFARSSGASPDPRDNTSVLRLSAGALEKNAPDDLAFSAAHERGHDGQLLRRDLPKQYTLNGGISYEYLPQDNVIIERDADLQAIRVMGLKSAQHAFFAEARALNRDVRDAATPRQKAEAPRQREVMFDFNVSDSAIRPHPSLGNRLYMIQQMMDFKQAGKELTAPVPLFTYPALQNSLLQKVSR